MPRGMLFAGLLVAGVAVPYLLTTPLPGSKPAGDASGANGPVPVALHPLLEPARPELLLPNSPIAARANLVAAVPITEALRFDASLAWILSRWSRVSTGLAELDLQGYRVPWISGTADDDVAGSLTYYFNREKQLEKITFRGTTGDARRLVGIVSERFEFRRQISNDPGLHVYQARWNGEPVSQLEIRAARVVRADQSHARFNVTLSIKNPDMGRDFGF